ncbi:MAG: alpha/beta hydrolase-fold protein [Candidatus Eiseniibacteriota bacterium]
MRARCLSLLVLGVLLGQLDVPSCQAQPASRSFDLESTEVGVTYAIDVVLPAAAASSDSSRDHLYPAIYCTDWFVLGDYLRSLPRLMDMGRLTEPFVFVGISEPGGGHEWAVARTRDFTPARPSDDYSVQHTYEPAIDSAGGAARFTAFLANELVPRIESEFPVDPARRAFAGYSLGALLGTHLVVHDPGLFHDFLLGSPSLWFNDFTLAGELAGMPAARLESVDRIYLSVGEKESWEMLRGFGMLRNALEARGMEPSRLRAEIIEGAGHVGAMPIALYNGIRFLMQPR